MAQDSWPSPAHNTRNVTDAEYEQLAAPHVDSGIIGTPDIAPVVTAGTGLTVVIRANATAALRGHFWTSGTTGDTLAIAANTSGQTRVDRVVLRLDRSTWTVRAGISQGTPGAVAPALVQDPGTTGIYEIPLAEVTLLDGASTVSVTRGELYRATGVRPQPSTRPNPHPSVGELHYQTDTRRLVVWNGSSWTVTHSRSGIVSAALTLEGWSLTSEPFLEVRDGSVHLSMGWFRRTGAAIAAGGFVPMPVLVPPAYQHPTRNILAIAHINGAAASLQIVSANSSQAGQVFMAGGPAINTNDDVSPASVSWAID